MTDGQVDDHVVRHVSELAKVDLDGDEIERFAVEFEAILEWFTALDDVPAVEEHESFENVLRPDAVRASLPAEKALENATETEDGYFRGPPVG